MIEVQEFPAAIDDELVEVPVGRRLAEFGFHGPEAFEGLADVRRGGAFGRSAEGFAGDRRPSESCTSSLVAPPAT